ncbi:unnamed protein product [Angiostrongylus costaricensis]|uniref:Ig-like domain-containing protein n=1 Tax=Angiostrongylus costaricensis TaxID=334426 RepID=A0A158PDE2_ANGCS|nr:unnamed protein product [Angiostrongylus costaricensis]
MFQGEKIWRKVSISNRQCITLSLVPQEFDFCYVRAEREVELPCTRKTRPGRDRFLTKRKDSVSMKEWLNEVLSAGRSTGEDCAPLVCEQPEDTNKVDLFREPEDKWKVMENNMYEQRRSSVSPFVDTLDKCGASYSALEDFCCKENDFLRISARTIAYLPQKDNCEYFDNYMGGKEIDKFQSRFYVYGGLPKPRQTNSTDWNRAPRFHMPLSRLRDIPEGAEMTLTCVVIGFPAPDITWLKNGKRLTREDSNMRYDDGVCTLTIPVTAVSNAAPHENDYTAPKFIEPLANQCVFEHDEIILECYVIGKPIPSVIWYKDGLKLMIEDRMLQYMDRKGYTNLNIMKAVQGDSGGYSCVAYNAIGKDFTHCRVQVVESLFGYLFAHHYEKLPPGSRELLELEVDGEPVPTVEWYHDDKLIAESRTLRTYFDGRVAILKIFEVQPDHQGCYLCKVGNRFGSAQSSAMLLVNQEAVEHVSQMPVFLDKINDITIRELGVSATFSCSIHGDPLPMVCWLHNGSAIHNHPCIRSCMTEGGSANLDIDVTTHDLCGTYTAVATNPFGWAHSSAVLKLELHDEKV